MTEYITRILDLPRDRSFFLFGPRQVGKSTLIQHRFSQESTIFYNLLLQKQLTRLSKDPDLLIEDLKTRPAEKEIVVIDEVQKLPQILDVVHYIIENTKNPPRFILTGSSARKLKRGQANMLGGRLFSYSLMPLIFPELKTDESFSLKKVLEFGTLPNIYLEKNTKLAAELLDSYVDVYLKEEIKAEALVRNLTSFTEFLRFAAEENGNNINFSSIAKDTGVSSNTIKEYFQILDDTLLGFYLLPFSRTVRKKVVKSPKFYFFDTGIKRALCNETSLELELKTKAYGKAFEHYIVKEIVHAAKYLNRNLEFSFYRTESGAEVDLIISKPNKEICAIEIKAKDHIRKSDLRGLKSFKAVCPEAQLFCVSLAPHVQDLDGIKVLPWQKIYDSFLNEKL